jgi:hypothetical protein
MRSSSLAVGDLLSLASCVFTYTRSNNSFVFHAERQTKVDLGCREGGRRSTAAAMSHRRHDRRSQLREDDRGEALYEIAYGEAETKRVESCNLWYLRSQGNATGYTPIAIAAKKGHASIVTMLVSAGADVSYQISKVRVGDGLHRSLCACRLRRAFQQQFPLLHVSALLRLTTGHLCSLDGTSVMNNMTFLNISIAFYVL